MSSAKFAHKRIGYIAAATSFRQDTDVLMLCTNLIKKDLSSNNFLETALALNGLATIVTPDLGRDLTPDLLAMLNHSRPYIRKRVILVLYKVFLKYPEALRIAFPRLKDKLEDPDPSVVSAVVNVVCELARRNPKSYLPLAPQLYGLLTTSSNNWMLIKIVKLFGALTPLEPRLTKKLVPPITNLIQTTQAMSLLYECIHTVICGGMISPEPSISKESNQEEVHDSALARLCVSKLKLFVEDPDQNLKYLGLYALCKLLPLRPRVVAEHKEVVLECLDDKDISIRMRALELLTGMVTKKNLPDIVRRLMLQLLPQSSDLATPTDRVFSMSTADKNYSKEVIERILNICSRDTYSMVTDFEWYISVLTRLVKVPFVSVGDKISLHLVDISVRVKTIREFAVKEMTGLLQDTVLLESASLAENNATVLYAAAWICSEYSSFIINKISVLDALTAPGVLQLPFSIQAICIHAALKLFSSWVSTEGSGIEVALSLQKLVESLKKFEDSPDIEVQERASSTILLLNFVHSRVLEGGHSAPELTALATLFSGELNPVAPTAQKKVPIPDGLDLDAWIVPPKPLPIDELDTGDEADDFWESSGITQKREKSGIESDESKTERRKRREAQKRMDPFYIPPSNLDDVDSIPIVKLSLDDIPRIDKPLKKTKKKAKKGSELLVEGLPSSRQVSYEINRGFEMPEMAIMDGGDREILDDIEKRRVAAADDPDTLAVLSVDFSAGSEAKPDFEIGRAALLASDLETKGTQELKVVRKKLDGEALIKSPKLKKKESGEKKEKSEKSADGKKKKKKGDAKEKIKSTKDESPQAHGSRSAHDLVVEISALESKTPLLGSLTVSSDPLDLSSRQILINETISATYHLDSEFDGDKSLLIITLSFLLYFRVPSGPVPSANLDLASEPPAFFIDASNGLASSVKMDMVGDSTLYQSSTALCLTLTGASTQSLPTIKGAFSFLQGGIPKKIDFAFTLPAAIFLKKPTSLDINPTTFATLLSNPSLFPFASSMQFTLDSVEKFEQTLGLIVRRSRMAQVEVVGGAASVYSATYGSSHIAGLIKMRPRVSRAGGGQGCSVTVDLKSGDQGLLVSILEDISELVAEL
ncbi:AP-3 complex subunit delta-1 [Dinochytrium kinnereticum]|nr:AP-3 complex subunit delta-1 [Dinochytrium kinnereticum]